MADEKYWYLKYFKHDLIDQKKDYLIMQFKSLLRTLKRLNLNMTNLS